VVYGYFSLRKTIYADDFGQINLRKAVEKTAYGYFRTRGIERKSIDGYLNLRKSISSSVSGSLATSRGYQQVVVPSSIYIATQPYGSSIEEYLNNYAIVQKQTRSVPDGTGGWYEDYETVYQRIACRLVPNSEGQRKLSQGDTIIGGYVMYVIGTVFPHFVTGSLPLRDIESNYRVLEYYNENREYRVLSVEDNSEGLYIRVNLEIVKES